MPAKKANGLSSLKANHLPRRTGSCSLVEQLGEIQMIQRSTAIALSLAFLFAEAGTATAGSFNCQMVSAKKADQNFKTNKMVTGLLAGGVTVYAIRTMVEKSKGPPKGAPL
jgi:hypothetical protein